MKIADCMDIYRCDNGHVFHAPQVELLPWGPGFRIHERYITVVSANGTIVVTTTDHLMPGDCALACPTCGQLHLFGFDLVDQKTVRTTKRSM